MPTGTSKPGKTSLATKAAVALVLLFLAAGLLLPLALSGPPESLLSRSASILAASRNGYQVSEPIELLAAPRLMLERGSLSFAPGKGIGPLTSEAAASWLASGQARLLLTDATISLDMDTVEPAPSDEHGEAIETIAPLLQALQRVSFDTLNIRRSTLVLRRPNGADQVLSNLQLNLDTNERRQHMAAKGSFDFRGMPVTLQGSIGLSPASFGAPLLPVEVKFRAPLIEGDLKGQLLADTAQQRLRLTAPATSITIPDLRRLARLAGLMWPDGAGFGAFRSEGQIDWTGSGLAFDKSTFELDGNTFLGSLLLSFENDRPRIEGTLATRRLDLAVYERQPPPQAATVAAQPAQQEVGNVKLARVVDLDVRLSAARIVTAAFEAGPGAATVSLKAGRLHADIADVSLGGDTRGIGQLSVDLGAEQPRYTMRGKIEQVAAQQVMRLLLGHELLQGRMTVLADISGPGLWPGLTAEGLSGRLTLSMPQGGRITADLNGIAATAAEQAASKKPGWGRVGTGDMVVDDLEARLSLAGKSITLNALRARSGDLMLRGSGSLDRSAQAIDFEVSSSRRGAVPVADAPPVQWHVQGNWMAPEIRELRQPRERSALPRS